MSNSQCGLITSFYASRPLRNFLHPFFAHISRPFEESSPRTTNDREVKVEAKIGKQL